MLPGFKEHKYMQGKRVKEFIPRGIIDFEQRIGRLEMEGHGPPVFGSENSSLLALLNHLMVH